jgi:hypothetical protein
MDTDTLIGQLSKDAQPVRRLHSPLVRTLVWLAIGLLTVPASTAVLPLRADLMAQLDDPRFVIEQVSAMLTAATAAFAALTLVVPGRSRRWIFLPLVPVSIWLASIGWGCLQDISRAILGVVVFESDWSCFPAIALIGAVPALAMVAMLRHGAPLMPGLVVALGGLAAAALGDFTLRLSHTIDSGLMVLIWQIGSVAILTAIAGWVGPSILHWRHSRRQAAARV